MTQIDETLFLFADSYVREVFEKILQARKIQVRDLKEKVADGDRLTAAIQMLTDKHLVETTESPVIDFATVYPTSEGLTVARKLRVPS